MADRRVTDTIRCVDCGSTNAYERCIDKVWDIKCPDCGSVFGWGNLPKECRDCKAPLRLSKDRGRGLCPKCHLETYSPEKRAALNKIISMAFRKPEPSDAEKDAAIDEAFKHLDEA